MAKIQTDDDTGDALRKKYLYRRLIMRGKLRLSRNAAIRIVGPDCAYHLYSQHRPEGKK